MNKQVEKLLNQWKEKCMVSNYTDEKAAEIAVNCISLSETWFSRVSPNEKASFEVNLYNKGKELVESLQGITRSNLPFVIMEALTTKKDSVSLIIVNSYRFGDNGKEILNTLGELEIY